MMTRIDHTKGRYKPVSPADTLRGRKAQRHGQMFENIFRSHLARSGLAWDRMPDGCKVVGRGKLIRVRTPYDWIVTHDGRTALLDTKSYDSERLTPSAIETHQLRALEGHERAGAVAGYIVYFRPIDLIAFASATRLAAILACGKGFHGCDLLSLGSALSCDPKRLFESEERG